MSKHLTLNANNPSPTVQPYLVLHFQGDNCANEWFVDVDGKIDLYLKNWTAVRDGREKLSVEERHRIHMVYNWLSQATPLLQTMMRELAEMNRIVNRVYGYNGTIRANYILRDGQFFKWLDPRLEYLPKDVPITQWEDIAEALPIILKQSDCTG